MKHKNGTVYVITLKKWWGVSRYVNGIFEHRYFPFMDLQDVTEFKRKLKAGKCVKKS